MRLARQLAWVVLGLAGCSLIGCRRSDNSRGYGSSNSGGDTTTHSDENAQGGSSSSGGNAFADPDYQQGKEAGLRLADRIAASGGPRIDVLPNFETGPGRPLPILVNFYEVLDEYPAYLVCMYDIEESHYDPSNEPAWFKASLMQIRHSGRQSFYFVRGAVRAFFRSNGLR
jgi:hypothetical protein